MKIELGVIDIPYALPAPMPKKVAKAHRGKKAPPVKRSAGGQTTGDVAEWLERKYGVMGAFAHDQMPAIAAQLEVSVGGALESLMMGAPAGFNVYGTFESAVQTMFRTYLDENEISHDGIQGVPTQAALNGVSHRLKMRRGPERPSFIDTGLYAQSFQAKVKDALGI